MTQVNLLPPELRQKQATRRTTALVALAGVAVLAVIAFFYFLQAMNLSRAQDDLAAQQSLNAQVQKQVADLQKFGELQAQLQTKQKLLGQVFANEVSWYGVLLDVSRIIPSDEYLSSLTGQIAPAGAAGAAPVTGPGGETLVGSISFSGTADQANTVAEWLTRLETVKGWANPWASSLTESGPFTKIYSFTSGVDLTSQTVTQRGRGGQQ